MNTSIIKFAIAVIPFITLVTSVIVFKLISSHNPHSLAFYRTRRNILRALASGVLMR